MSELVKSPVSYCRRVDRENGGRGGYEYPNIIGS